MQALPLQPGQAAPVLKALPDPCRTCTMLSAPAYPLPLLPQGLPPASLPVPPLCAAPLSGQSLWVRFWALTCCGPLSGVSDRSGHHLQQHGAVARPLPASPVWLHGPHVATTPPGLGVQTGQPGAAGRHLRHLGPTGGTSRTLSLCRSQCGLAGQHQRGQKQLSKVSLLENPVMSAANSSSSIPY